MSYAHAPRWVQNAITYGACLDLFDRRHALECSDAATRAPQRASIVDIGNSGPIAMLLGRHDPTMPKHAFMTVIDDGAAFSTMRRLFDAAFSR